jgi:hypothetical protein
MHLDDSGQQEITVLDNFVPKSLQDNIENLLFDGFFPYYFDKKTNVTSSDGHDVSQFIHNFYKNDSYSQWWSDVKPFFYFLESALSVKPNKVERVKANFLLPHHIRQHHPLHQDSQLDNAFSLLYYVNDTDGDTVFQYNNSIKTVSPKKGRAVFFKSTIQHAGSSPSKTPRIVINFVACFN